MKYTNAPEILALYARLEDLIALAERGEMAVTAFLSPREVLYAASCCEARLREGTACFVGGFRGSRDGLLPERRRLVLLPDYVAGMVSPEALADHPAAALYEAGLDDLGVQVTEAVCLLSLKGSGFYRLTHRDYLGSVLGLGLERDVLGDIFVTDEHDAILACKGEIAPFLLEHLTHVAGDTVRVERLSDGLAPELQRKSVPVHDTVASARLDCVVAALTNLSREKAQAAVKSGLVELNYEVVEACDCTVEPPCVLSVRGVGKFSVLSFDGETKKGRLRLSAERYV